LAGLQRGSAIPIPWSWVYIALPVGSLLMIVFAVRRIRDDVEALKGHPPADFDESPLTAPQGAPAVGPTMPE
jgi:TRAP-type C4-dicarboxylate transport system permease small subunit